MHKSLQAIIDDALAAEAAGDNTLGGVSREDASKYREAITDADMRGEFDDSEVKRIRAMRASDLYTDILLMGRAF